MDQTTRDALLAMYDVPDPARPGRVIPGYDKEHAERTTRIVLRVAEAVGLDGRRLADLEITTLLHDLGRTGMDPELFGAGFGLALACDFVYAAESARFTMAYTMVGLTPDGSSTYFLPRVVGLKRAIELTLTNRVLSAQEAEDLGIATRVVPDGELMDEAMSLARQLAAGPRSPWYRI